jgi:hypothetical protein
MTTAEEIRAHVAASLESDLPDRVLEVIRQEEGKILTKHILAKLPGGEKEWRITHVATMTHLETWSYTRSQGNHGYHFLVAYATVNVTIDPNFFVKHNVCYFDARKERNRKRIEAMNDAKACAAMARAIDRVRAARAELTAAEEDLEADMFSPDAYDFRKMAEQD